VRHTCCHLYGVKDMWKLQQRGAGHGVVVKGHLRCTPCMHSRPSQHVAAGGCTKQTMGRQVVRDSLGQGKAASNVYMLSAMCMAQAWHE
jgi:hypothetical protein